MKKLLSFAILVLFITTTVPITYASEKSTRDVYSSEYLVINSCRVSENWEFLELTISNVSDKPIIGLELYINYLDSDKEPIDGTTLTAGEWMEMEGDPLYISGNTYNVPISWNLSFIDWDLSERIDIYSMDVYLETIVLDPYEEVGIEETIVSIPVPDDIRVPSAQSARSKIKNVSIDKRFIYLSPGESCHLDLSGLIVSGWTPDKMKRLTSNTAVATIDSEWIITAHKPGYVFFTISGDGTFSLDSSETILCYVDYSDPNAKALSIDDFQVTMDDQKVILGSTTSEQMAKRWPSGNFDTDYGDLVFTYYNWEIGERIFCFFNSDNKVDYCSLKRNSITMRGMMPGYSSIEEIIAVYGFPSNVEPFFYISDDDIFGGATLYYSLEHADTSYELSFDLLYQFTDTHTVKLDSIRIAMY